MYEMQYLYIGVPKFRLGVPKSPSTGRASLQI